MSRVELRKKIIKQIGCTPNKPGFVILQLDKTVQRKDHLQSYWRVLNSNRIDITNTVAKLCDYKQSTSAYTLGDIILKQQCISPVTQIPTDMSANLGSELGIEVCKIRFGLEDRRAAVNRKMKNKDKN